MENLKEMSKELERILTDYYNSNIGSEYIKEVIPESTSFTIDGDDVIFFFEGAYYQDYKVVDVCIDVYANYVDHYHDFDFTLNKMMEEVNELCDYSEIHFSDDICMSVWIDKHNAKYPKFTINEDVKEYYETHHTFDVGDYTNYVDSSEIIFMDDYNDYELSEDELREVELSEDERDLYGQSIEAFEDNYNYMVEILDNNDVDIDDVFSTYSYSNREILAWNIKSNSIDIFHHAGNESYRSCTTLLFENGVKGV